MSNVGAAVATKGLDGIADVLFAMPSISAHRVAQRLDRTTVNPVLPIIFVVVIAVLAFLALAAIIGAIAAYIYYCQIHGGRWPGLRVPSARGDKFVLGCFR